MTFGFRHPHTDNDAFGIEIRFACPAAGADADDSDSDQESTNCRHWRGGWQWSSLLIASLDQNHDTFFLRPSCLARKSFGLTYVRLGPDFSGSSAVREAFCVQIEAARWVQLLSAEASDGHLSLHNVTANDCVELTGAPTLLKNEFLIFSLPGSAWERSFTTLCVHLEMPVKQERGKPSRTGAPSQCLGTSEPILSCLSVDHRRSTIDDRRLQNRTFRSARGLID